MMSATDVYQQKKQESHAAARKPRDAAGVLFGRSSPTTFLTSIRLAMLRKSRFSAPNVLAQNTTPNQDSKSFKVT